MKLNINAKELLALYNLLTQVMRQTLIVDDNDSAQLRQVHSRLKAIIIASLSGKEIDPVDLWLKHEQIKIDRLKDQNEIIKKEQAELAKSLKNNDVLVLENDEDYDAPDYPRRITRGHRGNRGGNKQ